MEEAQSFEHEAEAKFVLRGPVEYMTALHVSLPCSDPDAQNHDSSTFAAGAIPNGIANILLPTVFVVTPILPVPSIDTRARPIIASIFWHHSTAVGAPVIARLATIRLFPYTLPKRRNHTAECGAEILIEGDGPVFAAAAGCAGVVVWLGGAVGLAGGSAGCDLCKRRVYRLASLIAVAYRCMSCTSCP